MNFLLKIARSILILYFSLYALIHVLAHFYPTVANYVVFQHLVKWPLNDLKNPRSHGQFNVHNFYLDIEPDVKIGIWHFIPPPLKYDIEIDPKKDLKQHFENYFKQHDGRPIIIYSHGNDRDRAQKHRINLCQKLASLGYHVFAPDYRGYGDSTGVPTEAGVVKDLLTLYNFIKSYQKEAKIFLWGHSLGTGISAHAAKVLSDFNSPPAGVILEAPFKNISQAAKEYIVAPLILNNEWIKQKMDEALDLLNTRLNTAENILHINAKILIMHAQDDWFIPYDRSRELLQIAQTQRPRDYPPVRLIELEEHHGFGHCLIYQHEEIYPVVKEFVEN